MGFLRVRFGVYNPGSPGNVVEVEGLVDIGAIYTVIPRSTLEELGVRPLERRRFKAFGGYVERDIGEVGIVLMGRRRTVPVIFGDAEDVVLGVTALEAFGLEVDAVRGTLREAELLMLSLASDRGRGRLTRLKQPARTDHEWAASALSRYSARSVISLLTSSSSV